MKRLCPFNALIIAALLLAGLTSPTFGQDPPPVSLGPAPVEPTGVGIMATWPGPDGYGYIGQTISYNWVEISSTGTAVYLGDDDWDGPFSIGFTFNFYGTNWTQFYVGSNGFISFRSGSTSLSNDCPLPDAMAPDDIIALMWDDLDPSSTSDPVYYQSFGAGSCPYGSYVGACLVVQYDNFHHYSFLPPGPIAGTFEAILFDNGDVIIQFQDAGAEEGSGSTTGIENADVVADYGLTYACNSSGSLSDGPAIWFGFPTGLHLRPSELETTGCAGIPQTHTFDLLNNTGAAGTFALTYTVPSGNGILSGPATVVANDGETVGLDIELTPDECLPEGTQIIATIEASGNGYNDTSVITKTIAGDLGCWQSVPSSAPPWAGDGYPADGCSALNADGDWVTYLIGDRLSIPGFWGYHHATNTWFQPGAANTPFDRWAPDWAYDTETNLCYLTGGATAPGTGNINGTWVYDPVANAFAQLPNFTTGRDFHDSWVGRIDGTKYLCIGGGNSAYAGLTSTQCYDLDIAPANWQPENATMGAYPTDIWGAADGTLYISGRDQFWTVAGAQAGRISDAAWYFDDADNSWHSAGNTGYARYRLEGDFQHGDFYQIGGDLSFFTPTATVVRGRFNGTSWDWEQIDDLPSTRMDNIVGVTIPEVSPVPSTIWCIDGYGSSAADYVDYLIRCPSCGERGWLEGYVTDSELGDAEPPCTEAVVHIEPGAMDITADPVTGHYGPVQLISGTYTLETSAPGFSVETAVVDITAGVTTTQDFGLQRSVVDVEPRGFAITVPISQEVTYQLTITNDGHLPLDFEISELSTLPLNVLSEPQSSPGIEVEPELLLQLNADETSSYMIHFRERPDLSPAFQMDWHERGWFVMNALQETAKRSQVHVRTYLDAQGADYQAFWIDNAIVVKSSRHATLNGLMTFTEIEALRAPRCATLHKSGEITPSQVIPMAIEPNISHVGADQVWGLGFTGEGLVVANIDTGVRYTHNALVNQYRGNLGGDSYDHDCNWLDAASGSNTPVDDHGHGSHTMGTMIGDDGGANQIGMAPDARWIACDGCEGINCPEAALLTCAQWIAAPYPIGNPGSPDPDRRPHVVNNSWGDCSQTYDNWYQDAIDAWHAAGIYPVFSNGNAGNCSYPSPPGCNTASNPARYGNVTGVGSTGRSNGQYATHSNWGPTDNPDTVNPRGYPSLKPQVMAPGVNIRSSVNIDNSAYSRVTGTSMSAPHVAGLIALMWQAAPCMVGDYATTETLIEQTVTPIPYTSGCGGEGPDNVPNHATGWGEINALAAVQAAMDYCEAGWLPWVWEGPISGTIPGPGEIEIDITFHCTETCDYTGTLRILHSDPCQDPVDVSIVLHCQPLNRPNPDIEVDPLSLSAWLNPEGTTTRTLTISNVGTANLTWNLVENPPVSWLSEAPTNGPVALSDSTDVTVSFDATGLADGVYTTTLQVNSDDPDEPQVDVSTVLAVTIAPPPPDTTIYLPIIIKKATP